MNWCWTDKFHSEQISNSFSSFKPQMQFKHHIHVHFIKITRTSNYLISLFSCWTLSQFLLSSHFKLLAPLKLLCTSPHSKISNPIGPPLIYSTRVLHPSTDGVISQRGLDPRVDEPDLSFEETQFFLCKSLAD